MASSNYLVQLCLNIIEELRHPVVSGSEPVLVLDSDDRPACSLRNCFTERKGQFNSQLYFPETGSIVVPTGTCFTSEGGVLGSTRRHEFFIAKTVVVLDSQPKTPIVYVEGDRGPVVRLFEQAGLLKKIKIQASSLGRVRNFAGNRAYSGADAIIRYGLKEAFKK